MNFFKAYSFDEFTLTSFKKGQKNGITQLVPFSRIKTPFMIVNIGSGVSVLKINESNGIFSCSRVGGTSLGGGIFIENLGFFMGLARLLLDETDFEKLLDLASKGSNEAVDFIFEDFPQAAGYLSEASVLVSLAKLNKLSKR